MTKEDFERRLKEWGHETDGRIPISIVVAFDTLLTTSGEVLLHLQLVKDVPHREAIARGEADFQRIQMAIDGDMARKIAAALMEPNRPPKAN